MTDHHPCRDDRAPAVPSVGAPYGFGLSESSGSVVHILAEPWRSTFWPGSPNSLWAEDRVPRHGMSAWALCDRGVQWKTGPPGNARHFCRWCLMPAHQRTLYLTGLHSVPNENTDDHHL
ncbi:hypothetical protein ACX9I7_01240 [Streptomyces sp. L500]